MENKIQVCANCEPVQHDDMKEHLKDSHVVTKCNLCNSSMEKWKLEGHKIECPKRFVTCKYCEIEFSLDELYEHVEHCGSRTEQCSTCKLYVMLKDLKKHPELCLQVHSYTESIKSFNSEKTSDALRKDISSEELTASAYSASAFRDLSKPIKVPAHFGGWSMGPIFLPWIEMDTHIPTCASCSNNCSSVGEHVKCDGLKTDDLNGCPALHQHKSGSKHNVVQDPAINGDIFAHNKETSSLTAATGTKHHTCCERKCSEGDTSNCSKSCNENIFICVLCLELVSESQRRSHEVMFCKWLQDCYEEQECLGKERMTHEVISNKVLQDKEERQASLNSSLDADVGKEKPSKI